MDRSVRDYRDRHPLAREWATGSRKVVHTEATQARVFRMAEQIRAGLEWPTVRAIFSVLRSLDEVVDAETPATGRPQPAAAAAAAAVGYKVLFGSFPPLAHHAWPKGFEPVGEEDAALAALGLQARGFDPLVIDGIDPAAYLWAFFEMDHREESCDEVTRLGQHVARQPRCLAVVPDLTLPRAAEPMTRSLAAAGAGR